jgi:thymidylate synthase
MSSCWQITYRETLRAALCAQPERYRNGYRLSVWAPPALRIPGDDPGVLTLRDFEPAFAYQELEWMLSGDSSLSAASALVRRIWAPWQRSGSIGPLYHGALARVRTHLIPALRRCRELGVSDSGVLFSTWQHHLIDQVVEPCIRPCHGTVFHVRPRASGLLDAYAYQRSADLGVGVPSNVAFYTRLLSIVAAESGHARGELVYQLGDAHLYDDQVEAAAQLLDAQPGDRRPVRYPKARL